MVRCGCRRAGVCLSLSAPVPRTRCSMADNDLSYDLAARIVAPTSLGVVEGKHAVDDGPDLMLRHHAAEVLQVTAAARRDWLEPRLAHEDGPEVHSAISGRQSPHQRDLAAIGDGFG